MASSMWSALEGNVMSSSGMSSVSKAAVDPTTMLNNQLASALSTMGDAQYWEESISPATIRQSLQDAGDPSNPNFTTNILRAMKWLLASISKGRDVSDFYPHVVKLVGVVNLQVRKMVYMYLVQYANHNATTRELSLLSINAFQRGLADAEQLIRALALRVLTSIRIPDILQIQILAVQKCAKDKSPYVRKCAAAALAKLAPSSSSSTSSHVNNDQQQQPPWDQEQQSLLEEIIRDLLNHDQSTMVLTSALIAFNELCPDRLDWLHSCFHKVCHLLTDMDEWGQVVAIDLLARYCRRFFRQPVAWKEGTAERIDRERRVRRTRLGIAAPVMVTDYSSTAAAATATPTGPVAVASAPCALPPHPKAGQPRKIKRRVVKKGFYSDEEDESTEEEVYTRTPTGLSLPVSSVFRENEVLNSNNSNNNQNNLPVVGLDDTEDEELAPDHRKILHSAMSLLKSRNSGVVLAVCSLQYYCGVSSIRVRTAMGKALVRIHRDRREIQYVVLRSIQTLAKECPSAFAPFLNDFFVKAMDPPFTRVIKLDVLVSLALEPFAIQTVLKELGSYVRRRGDKEFVCASIRAVGRVTEMARIVFDRHGAAESTVAQERALANQIALNCLQGLLTLTQTSDSTVVVGEAVQVMQCILRMLQSDAVINEGDLMKVDDQHKVRARSMRRILLLLIHTLACRVNEEDETDRVDDNDDEKEESATTDLEQLGVCLPPTANASAIWISAEYLAPISGLSSGSCMFVFGKSYEKKPSKLRFEVARCLARSFTELHECEKEQAIHFASRLLMSAAAADRSCATMEEGPLCEHILSMGRVDVNPEVRDQARFDSGVVHVTIGLKHDIDSLETIPSNARNLTLQDTKQVFLGIKPPASFLPVEDELRTGSGETSGFRFGTLSSLVGHRARSVYQPLPPWAEENSPDVLREPPKQDSQPKDGWKASRGGGGEMNQSRFYEGDSHPSSSDSSSSESDESSDDDSSSEESSSSSDSEDSEEKRQAGSVQQLTPMQQQGWSVAPVNSQKPSVQTRQANVTVDSESSDDESSSSSSSSGDSSEDSKPPGANSSNVGSLIPMGGATASATSKSVMNGSSVADDLKGLILAPVVVDAETQPTNPDFERDSGAWLQLVRPEHSRGLSVKARYLRGITKSKQAQLLGLAADTPTLVCMQIRFENETQDNGTFRRLRIVQRSSSTSTSAVRPLKIVAPPEIAQLQAGQRTDCVLGIEFSGASDRDGSMLARVDVKFGSGGVSVEIKPTIGDLLLPYKCFVSDFDAAVHRLRGFQRVESALSLESNRVTSLLNRMLEVAALTPVGKNSELPFRLVGALPASGDPVYVRVDANGVGQGTVVVCCIHALVVSSISSLMKRALQT